MTARELVLDCPRCAGRTPHVVYSTPVVGCAGQLLIAESAECRRCCHRTEHRVGRLERCLPGTLPARTDCP
ncbi:hypothetical protein ABT174_20295 [Streptomyces sparsogenes]|uniref:hypothetical protein n=1 Tax=Streptomyces sparsogenes TaxID=67365 RepID=UPI00331B6FAA